MAEGARPRVPGSGCPRDSRLAVPGDEAGLPPPRSSPSARRQRPETAAARSPEFPLVPDTIQHLQGRRRIAPITHSSSPAQQGGVVGVSPGVPEVCW